MAKKTITKTQIETEESENLYARLENLFNEPGVYVIKIYRRRPANPPYSGYLTEFQEAVTEDEIKNRFGGGKFQATAHNEKGQFIKSMTFEIAGKSKVEEQPEEEQPEPQHNGKGFKHLEEAYQGVFEAQNKAFENILSFFAKLNETSKEQDRAFFERMHTLTTEAHQNNLELLKAAHNLELSKAQNENAQDIIETILANAPEDKRDNLQKMLQSGINFLSPFLKDFTPFLKQLVNDETVQLLLERINPDKEPIPENQGNKAVNPKRKT